MDLEYGLNVGFSYIYEHTTVKTKCRKNSSPSITFDNVQQSLMKNKNTLILMTQE